MSLVVLSLDLSSIVRLLFCLFTILPVATCCAAAIIELQSILMQLSPHVKYIIVAGDFNIDLKSNLSISKKHRNLFDDFCLIQHISEPSRMSRASATLIDHISSSNCNQLPVVHLHQAVGLSDHYRCIQCVDFEVPIHPQEVRTMWICSFQKCDWDKLHEALSYAPWCINVRIT